MKYSLSKSQANGILTVLAVPFAVFEAISIHSVFTGDPAGGALTGLLVTGIAMVAAIFILVSKTDRHRLMSLAAIVVSVVAVLSALALAGKLSAMRDVAPGGIFSTVLLLLFQTGWAFTYWLAAAKGKPDKARYIPAAIGTVAMLLGGLLGGGLIPAGKPAAPEPMAEKFVTLASAGIIEFARATDRVGNVNKGSDFVHYHTGQLPLIGISFSTRDWMRRERIGNDLRGIFDREAATDAQHVLLARPGYTVSAIEVRAGEHINALRVQFAGTEGAQLDLADSYWSDWVGSYEPGERTTAIESFFEPVVGLSGTQGLVLNSVGLLLAKQ